MHLDGTKKKKKSGGKLGGDSVKYITHYHIISASLLQVVTK